MSNDATMESFVAQARQYVGRYRGRQAVLTHLSEMSGIDFDPSDHVLHFVNGYDEDLIFWKRPGDALATLLLSPHDWEQYLVSLESLMRSEIPQPEGGTASGPVSRSIDFDLPTAEDLELDRSEIMWVISCFISTRQADEESEELARLDECVGCLNCTGEEPDEHGSIAADNLHDYIITRIIDRIQADPDLLLRSITAMREDGQLGPGTVAELGPLEADPRIVRQVAELSHTTREDLEPEAFRLIVLYLIHRIYVSGPHYPSTSRSELYGVSPSWSAWRPLKTVEDR